MADDPRPGDVPVEPDEHDAELVAPPRRAASAEFIVSSEIGSEALMREAMDPANQSLQEALRLSYRVLQGVMMLLIVVFVFSGIKTVESGETGVMLQWGRIVGDDGEQVLDPGAHFNLLPYPAGEFVLLPESDRRVNLGNTFWPQMRGTTAEAVASATIHDSIAPGRDGSVLCVDGDIAHIRIHGDYEVVDPVDFLRNVTDEEVETGTLHADRLVELAMRRAIVHTAAVRTVEDFADFDPTEVEAITRQTQQYLDRAGSGMRLLRVETPEVPRPAFAAQREIDNLQQSIQQSTNLVNSAREEARNLVLRHLRTDFGSTPIFEMIDAYRTAFDDGAFDEAESIRGEINAYLASDEVKGNVAKTLQRAKSHNSMVELTIGQDARRFQRLLPSFRDDPQLMVQRLWSAAYRNVVTPRDAHVTYVPAGVGRYQLLLSMPSEIANLRRDKKLDMKEQSRNMEALMERGEVLRTTGDAREGAGRTLERDGTPLQR